MKFDRYIAGKKHVFADSVAASRPRRSVASIDYEEEKLESEDETDLLRLEKNDDDTEYAPPIDHFSIGLRLTSQNKTAVRTGVHAPIIKASPQQAVTNKAGRQNAASVMGQSANQVISAQGGKYNGEWLHLIGDALGGPTTATNLVAGSYAANTEMLVIETRLIGCTQMEIQVIAHCSSQNFAEFIDYHVYLARNRSKHYEHRIDARNEYFSKKDWDDLDKHFWAWLKPLSQSFFT